MTERDARFADAAPVRLRVRDTEDLEVAASLLQDAVATVGQMTFVPEERRFVLIVQRFRWERGADDAAPAERGNCAVRIEHVRGARCRGFDREESGRVLNLLSFARAPERLDILFSGGADVSLDVDALDMFVEDIGLPWPTPFRPRHAGSETDRERRGTAR